MIKLRVDEPTPIRLAPSVEEPAKMRVAESYNVELLNAAIYVDGTTLYINTPITDGNEVEY